MTPSHPRYTPYLTSQSQQYAPPCPDHTGNEHLRDCETATLLWYLYWGYLDACWANWVDTDPQAIEDMAHYPHLRRKPSQAPGGPQGIFPYDHCRLSAGEQVLTVGLGTYHDWCDLDSERPSKLDLDNQRLQQMLAGLKKR
jgi:hypothetical protein